MSEIAKIIENNSEKLTEIKDGKYVNNIFIYPNTCTSEELVIGLGYIFRDNRTIVNMQYDVKTIKVTLSPTP